MAARWVQSLRAAPIAVPCAGVVALLIVTAARQGGYGVSTWAPVGIVVLGLLGVAVATVPQPWAAVPRAARLAAVLLGLYTLLSYASLAWAADRGAAWEGANRTLLYLVVFCLFALWRQEPRTAAVLLGVWTLAVGVIALVVAVRLAGADDAQTVLPRGLLRAPTGYHNASAALMLMAFWPALGLAAARPLAWPLRAVCAAGAVLLAGVALLAVSRGSLLAMPICLVLFFAVVPGRLRHAATLVPIAIGVAIAGRPIIHLTTRLGVDQPPVGLSGAAAGGSILAGAALAGVTVAAVLVAARRRPPSVATVARVRRAGGLACGLAIAGVLIGGLAVAGNPVTRAQSAWRSFKGGYTEASGSRLSSGLGSNRYDFYRVGLATFRTHPLVGIGVDNFAQSYLRSGRSLETPRYPHSIELRALVQTGALGALLLFGAITAALTAALTALRRRDDPLRGAVAGGAVAAFVYWLVHGSADWFFEYAGLGTAAFALLGLACGLGCGRSAPTATRSPAPDARGAGHRVLAPLIAGAALAAGMFALAGLWGADHEVRRAGRVFAARPREAYERLDRARWMAPFSDRADTVAGAVAVRLDDLVRADRAFRRALSRSRSDEYATLQLGAIASARGDRATALGQLTRARQLAPRDALARDALEVVRTGGRIDLAALSRRILQQSAQLG